MNRMIEKSNLCKFFLEEFNVDLTNPPKEMVELARKVTNVILDHIEMPDHKLMYVIRTELVSGLRDCIPHYGIRYTKEVHETLVEAVRQRFTDGADIEYEWTEQEYNNFVLWKPEYHK